jgi:hypothetical protein
VKKKLLFISTITFILLANKIILSKLILFSLEKWIDKDIIVKDFNISYKKKEISINDIIINNKNTSSENIFKASKVNIKLKLSSLFTTLILIEQINIKNPILNLNFDISHDNKDLLKDNLGILKNLKKKKNPKIYPKKFIDINFLVLNSSLENFKINIKRSDLTNKDSIILSNMHFKKFGNELGYQHYKDVFEIILMDLVMRIPDQELKKIIKKYYKSPQ